VNICLCGAQAGYPHAEHCPRPLYRCTDAQADRWAREAEAMRILAGTGLAVAEGAERGPWTE